MCACVTSEIENGAPGLMSIFAIFYPASPQNHPHSSVFRIGPCIALRSCWAAYPEPVIEGRRYPRQPSVHCGLPCRLRRGRRSDPTWGANCEFARSRLLEVVSMHAPRAGSDAPRKDLLSGQQLPTPPLSRLQAKCLRARSRSRGANAVVCSPPHFRTTATPGFDDTTWPGHNLDCTGSLPVAAVARKMTSSSEFS